MKGGQRIDTKETLAYFLVILIFVFICVLYMNEIHLSLRQHLSPKTVDQISVNVKETGVDQATFPLTFVDVAAGVGVVYIIILPYIGLRFQI